MYKEIFSAMQLTRMPQQSAGKTGTLGDAEFLAFHVYFREYGTCFLVAITGKTKDIEDLYATFEKELGEPIVFKRTGKIWSCLWASDSKELPVSEIEKKISTSRLQLIYEKVGLTQEEKLVVRSVLLDIDDSAGETVLVYKNPHFIAIDEIGKMKVSMVIESIRSMNS